MKSHNYLIYITTNSNKTVFYVGMTNDLTYRLEQLQTLATKILTG
ncbi:GIY-YIG nuclease family protein [Pontibacter virosus]|nr:GIY-YIG nuclease family protein [Pontibacter virosus]